MKSADDVVKGMQQESTRFKWNATCCGARSLTPSGTYERRREPEGGRTPSGRNEASGQDSEEGSNSCQEPAKEG